MKRFWGLHAIAWIVSFSLIPAAVVLAGAPQDVETTAPCKLDITRFQNPAAVDLHPESDPTRLTWSRRHVHLFNSTSTVGYAVVSLTLQQAGRVTKTEVVEQCSSTDVDLGRIARGIASGTRWMANDGQSLEGLTVYLAYKFPYE